MDIEHLLTQSVIVSIAGWVIKRLIDARDRATNEFREHLNADMLTLKADVVTTKIHSAKASGTITAIQTRFEDHIREDERWQESTTRELDQIQERLKSAG